MGLEGSGVCKFVASSNVIYHLSMQSHSQNSLLHSTHTNMQKRYFGELEGRFTARIMVECRTSNNSI